MTYWHIRPDIARALLALMLVAVLGGPAAAQLFETRAGQAILLDAKSGTILYAKDANKRVPPASLAKMMTMEVVFDALKRGRLSLDDEFHVSEYAWREGGAVSGGSTMFAELNSTIRLEDLIRGVIIQSANDGCIIIAEGMAGSEANFARLMTERAREIGLRDSVFYNSTGLPAEGQYVTMYDLAKLADHLQREYPEYYRFYSEPEFTWNGILQRNRNPLLKMGIGADGVKTGYTEASGYAIVGSVQRGDRRMITAMSGLPDRRTRAEEARKILDWGDRAFEAHRIFEQDEVIGNVRLYGGARLTVPVVANDDLDILLPLANRDALKARVVYKGPVRAPVAAGDEIATLKVWIGDELTQETPLFAQESVPRGPIHRQAFDALTELVLGWI